MSKSKVIIDHLPHKPLLLHLPKRRLQHQPLFVDAGGTHEPRELQVASPSHTVFVAPVWFLASL